MAGCTFIMLYPVSTDSVARGSRATLSPDNKYLVFQVKPTYDETRQAKKKKLKEDKMPKNNLEIRLLPGDKVTTIQMVKSFSVPEESSYWMAYLIEKKPEENKDTKVTGDSTKSVNTPAPKGKKPPEPKGTELVIFNPVVNKEYRYNDVTEYVVARDGKTISYLQDFPDTTKIDNFRVNVFDTKNEISAIVFEGKGTVKKLSTNKTGDEVSFIYTQDTSKVKVYDLYLTKGDGKSVKIVESANPAMPSGWSVSENGNITFSDDGTRMFFGTAVKPVKEPEDTLYWMMKNISLISGHGMMIFFSQCKRSNLTRNKKELIRLSTILIKV